LVRRVGRDDVVVLLPKPAAMNDREYRKLMRNNTAQQKVWRELWLGWLEVFGAKRL
jgi:hypothetical protein